MPNDSKKKSFSSFEIQLPVGGKKQLTDAELKKKNQKACWVLHFDFPFPIAILSSMQPGLIAMDYIRNPIALPAVLYKVRYCFPLLYLSELFRR